MGESCRESSFEKWLRDSAPAHTYYTVPYEREKFCAAIGVSPVKKGVSKSLPFWSHEILSLLRVRCATDIAAVTENGAGPSALRMRTLATYGLSDIKLAREFLHDKTCNVGEYLYRVAGRKLVDTVQKCITESSTEEGLPSLVPESFCLRLVRSRLTFSDLEQLRDATAEKECAFMVSPKVWEMLSRLEQMRAEHGKQSLLKPSPDGAQRCRLWNCPVAVNRYLPAGLALCASFRDYELLWAHEGTTFVRVPPSSESDSLNCTRFRAFQTIGAGWERAPAAAKLLLE